MSDTTTATRTPKKAALAAWTGSALEYYDLAIYGTAAALVFPDIFFPEGNDSAATVAAFATFGVAYVARPIGSFLMGHIGDRLGRKKVLIGTLLLMGVSTFLVGCLPTYQQVGMLAPVLLVILRLLQGLSAAGEQAGANSMSFEHAPDDRRGFFTSFTLSGTQGGQVLAPAVFLPLAAVLPEEQLLSWGWRVPFWISAMVVIVGFVIRRSLDETPAFQAEADSGEVPRAPLGVLFGDHWRGVLRVFLAAFIAMVNTMFQIFALNFATSDDYEIGFSDTFMLWLAIVANLVAIAVIPFWARLSDRVGRKQVFVTGVVGSGILIWGFLGAIAAGNEPLTFVLGVAPGRRRLQHAERRVARDVRRVLPDPGPALGHGDRHPVRVRPRRLHPDHRRRADGRRDRQLGPGRALRLGRLRHLGDRRAHGPGAHAPGAHSRRRDAAAHAPTPPRRPSGSRERRGRRDRSFTLGLVGAGIGGSLTPAMQEREGARVGARRQLPDHRRRRARPRGRRPAGDPGLGRAARVRRAQHHPPLQAGGGRRSRRPVGGRRGPRRGQHGGPARRSPAGPQHRLVRLLPGRSARRCRRRCQDRAVLVGAGGAGVAVGYALLHQGAEHVAVVDADRERADACVVRLAKRFGDDRVGVATDLARALAEAGGLVNATPVGMNGHAGTSVPADLLRPGTCGSATSCTSRSRPS